MTRDTLAAPLDGGAMGRRTFLRTGCGALIAGLTASGLGALYARHIEPGWIECTRQEIRLPSLSKELDGLTIVQLSDIHLGPYLQVNDVRRAVELANDLHPDLIVLTGDYVSVSAHYSASCAEALATLHARHGLYAVLGNHDIWTDADLVADNLRGRGS